MEKFTEKYFDEELSRFRELCGQKTFWQGSEDMREACINGLGIVYLNCYPEDGTDPTKDFIERQAYKLHMAFMNYNQRASMILRFPSKKLPSPRIVI